MSNEHHKDHGHGDDHGHKPDIYKILVDHKPHDWLKPVINGAEIKRLCARGRRDLRCLAGRPRPGGRTCRGHHGSRSDETRHREVLHDQEDNHGGLRE